MENAKLCEACGGPAENQYCEHCVDENGNLKSYAEILEGGTDWALSEEGEKIMGKKFENKEDAKEAIQLHMKTLPEWRDN